MCHIKTALLPFSLCKRPAIIYYWLINLKTCGIDCKTHAVDKPEQVK